MMLKNIIYLKPTEKTIIQLCSNYVVQILRVDIYYATFALVYDLFSVR